MKYKVIKGIFEGLEFNGHPVTIAGESRIWNDDSQGQAFPAENCIEVVIDDENNPTVRELRAALFSIDNQEMTVRELRNALFNVKNQEAKIDLSLIFGVNSLQGILLEGKN